MSMEEKGRLVDNVFVEPLWQRVKYVDVYLKAYESTTHGRKSLSGYVNFYNAE